MPSVYTNMKDVRDGGRAAKQSRHHTKMAPMIQPFMDSLPDSCDPLNNDGEINVLFSASHCVFFPQFYIYFVLILILKLIFRAQFQKAV